MSTTDPQPEPEQPEPEQPDENADKLRPGERRVDVTDDGVTVEDKPAS